MIVYYITDVLLSPEPMRVDPKRLSMEAAVQSLMKSYYAQSPLERWAGGSTAAPNVDHLRLVRVQIPCIERGNEGWIINGDSFRYITAFRDDTVPPQLEIEDTPLHEIRKFKNHGLPETYLDTRGNIRRGADGSLVMEGPNGAPELSSSQSVFSGVTASPAMIQKWGLPPGSRVKSNYFSNPPPPASAP